MTMRRTLAVTAAVVAAALALATAAAWLVMIAMPGESHEGALPSPSAKESAREADLRLAVTELASRIGERHVEKGETLDRAAAFVESGLAGAGLAPSSQIFAVDGRQVRNVEATLSGSSRPQEIVVVGANYDSMRGSPGADTNASGLGALLALARELKAAGPLPRSVRFAAFVNKEPPYFQTEHMGSRVHAEAARVKGEAIVAMLNLQSLGYFADERGSQKYPPPLNLLYPDTGNFVAFVGDLSSRALVRRSVAAFRAGVRFPSVGAALPAALPGVGWSDHWSFWQAGYPAVMVSDTAMFRHPAFGTAGDTPEKLDYQRLARVVTGLAAVVRELAGDD